MLTVELRKKKIQYLSDKISELKSLDAHWLRDDYRQGMIRAFSYSLSLHEQELIREERRAPKQLQASSKASRYQC